MASRGAARRLAQVKMLVFRPGDTGDSEATDRKVDFMPAPRKYPQELRERAIRMALDILDEDPN